MMYENWWNNYRGMMYPGFWVGNWFGLFLIPFMLWGLFWKGWALWRAAKNDSRGWFIALLLINTMGILEILYLFVFGGKEKKSRKK